MVRKISFMVLVLALGLVLAVPALADPGKPNFSAGVYADGEAWGTKATTSLPAPNGKNNQSFDKIFVFTNGAEGQLPVGEAAPGNPSSNHALSPDARSEKATTQGFSLLPAMKKSLWDLLIL